MDFNFSTKYYTAGNMVLAMLLIFPVLYVNLLAEEKESASSASEKCLGVNDNLIWRTIEVQEVAFIKYVESGTRFIRMDACWSVLEGKGKGIYNPLYVDRVDSFMKKASENRIKVLMIADYAPAWANGGNEGSGWAPLNETDFADFCEWLLRRYASYKDPDGKRTLEAIELWNEPDLSDLFFKPFKRRCSEGATLYGKLVVVAGGRLKTVRKEISADDVLILAPCISEPHSVAYEPWLDAFYAVPEVTKNYDVFSWHSYWESSGSGWLPAELPPCFSDKLQRQSVLGKLTAEKDKFWPKIVAAGDHLKPNWCTEVGGASKSDMPEHRERLLSFAEQKTHLEDVVSVLNSDKITNMNRVYWFTLFDNPSQKREQAFYGLIALNQTNPISYSGGISLKNAVLTPKPAYEVYKNFSTSKTKNQGEKQ